MTCPNRPGRGHVIAAWCDMDSDVIKHIRSMDQTNEIAGFDILAGISSVLGGMDFESSLPVAILPLTFASNLGVILFRYQFEGFSFS